MAIISPSILSADFCRLEEDCRLVLDAGAQMLHFDVMDGHFVPNISFGVPVLASLHRGMPSAFFDVHLMISHPLDYVDAFAGAGAGLINFHLESEDDPGDVLHAIRAAGCKAGMTIKPDTPVWRPEVPVLGPAQAGGPQGGAEGPGPGFPAGSGRRRQRRDRALLRGGRRRHPGGGQRHLFGGRPCRRRGGPCLPLTLP